MPQFVAGNGTLDSDGGGAAIDFPGGTGTVQANYVGGTGTLTLHVSLDGGTTYTSGGASVQLTGSGLFNFTLPPCKIRLVLSSAASANIGYWVGAPTSA